MTTLAQIKDIELGVHFGLKIKDYCFFRTSADRMGFHELVTDMIFYNWNDVIEIIHGARLIPGRLETLTVFACYCHKCKTPEQIQRVKELDAQGIEVSHGLWDICHKEEMIRLENEEMTERLRNA